MPPASGSGVTGPVQIGREAARSSGGHRGEAEAGAGAGGGGGHHAVGDHGEHGDAGAGDEAGADVGAGERDVDLLAEVAGADQRGDDQHGDREQDRLVDAEQDLGQRQRQPELEEALRRRGAHGAGGLDERGVDLADAERGVADGRGERVEDDGDHGGELADAEQHDDGDEVDEGGQRLQRVDDRLHDAPGARG